jgi:restriction endonuclease Mrr
MDTATSLRVLRLRLALARLPARLHVDPFAVIAVLAPAVGLLVGIAFAVLFRTSLVPAVIATLVPTITLISITPFLFTSELAPIEHAASAMESLLAQLAREKSTSKASVDEWRARAAESERIREGILRAVQHPLLRLLNADIGVMSGADFEIYLEDVFRFLGCQVEATGRSGDQGVDLIVSRDDGRRLAVQAKCHSGSVGNYAVQEVYTGMRIHGCHACMVITSSRFTSAASDAAAATGCRLVEGWQIPDLIRGRLAFH